MPATTGLRRSKSAVLDSAYEQYCRCVDAGEAVEVQAFVQRFPGYQSSLLRQIEAHEWLAAHTGLLEAPIVWPLQGEEFLGFHLLEELGRGAFSRVFLAEELALGERSVVVKVSRLSGMEPQALGRLRHPNIVPVHSVQFDDRRGLSAICMPFYGRATLYDLLDHAFRRGTIPLRGREVDEAIDRAVTAGDPAAGDPAEEAPRRATRDWWDTSYANAIVRLGMQLCDALEFAHRGGIFHCDIKPSNVLLCRSGVKLFDFNLALDEAAETGRGGTLPYMAPEQLRVVAGKIDRATLNDPAARIDARTDLFSLGVLLYELLSGQSPWGPPPTHLPADRAAEELLERHQRGPKPLRGLAPALNPRLARVIHSCLAFVPGDRPVTAVELAAALRRELRWAPRRTVLSRASPNGALGPGVGRAAGCRRRQPLGYRRGRHGSAYTAWPEGFRGGGLSTRDRAFRGGAGGRTAQSPRALLEGEGTHALGPARDCDGGPQAASGGFADRPVCKAVLGILPGRGRKAAGRVREGGGRASVRLRRVCGECRILQ